MSDDSDSLIMPNYGEINGNLEENPENQFAATEDVIKSKLRQIGCHYVGATITSYTYKAPNGKHFHIPKALGGVGYTVSQFSFIERVLNAFELDIFPLDYNLS